MARNPNEPTHLAACSYGSQTVCKNSTRRQTLGQEINGKRAYSTNRTELTRPASDRRGNILGGPGAYHARTTAVERRLLPASASGLIAIRKDTVDGHRQAAIRTYERWISVQKNQPTPVKNGPTAEEINGSAAALAPGSVHGSRLDILSTGSYKASRALRRSPRATGHKLAPLQTRAANRSYDTSDSVLGYQNGSKE